MALVLAETDLEEDRFGHAFASHSACCKQLLASIGNLPVGGLNEIRMMTGCVYMLLGYGRRQMAQGASI